VSAERLVSGSLTVILAATTVFGCTTLGAAVDAGNVGAIIVAGILVTCSGVAAWFFARDLFHTFPEPDVTEQEQEAWDSLYEIPPGYRRVHGQPATPFDLKED
jgi:hypothetical protein